MLRAVCPLVLLCVSGPARADLPAEALPHVELFPTTSSAAPGGPRLGSGIVTLDPLVVVAPRPRPAPVYYGYQTLLVRLGGIGVMAASGVVANEAEGVSTAGFILGAGAVVFGPVVVHAVHGQPVNAVVSIAMNLLLSTGGAGLGALVGSATGGSGDFGWGVAIGGFFGLATGQLAILILDLTWLGFEDQPREDRVTLLPTVVPAPDGTPLAGLGFTF